MRHCEYCKRPFDSTSFKHGEVDDFDFCSTLCLQRYAEDYREHELHERPLHPDDALDVADAMAIALEYAREKMR